MVTARVAKDTLAAACSLRGCCSQSSSSSAAGGLSGGGGCCSCCCGSGDSAARSSYHLDSGGTDQETAEEAQGLLEAGAADSSHTHAVTI